MLVNLPIEMTLIISEFLHVDEACRFLSFTCACIKYNTLNKVCLYKCRIDSCLLLKLWQIDNKNLCDDFTKEFAHSYITDYEFIKTMTLRLSMPGILHAYEYSYFRNRPRVWRYNPRISLINNTYDHGWQKVCAIYFVPMGPLSKIRNRPNVAALVY